MARKDSKKSTTVAFKIEEELAEFLDALPNKSEYIRRAIIAQFGMTCPLCTGSGTVARGLHTHYKPVIQEHSNRPCERCKTPERVPLSLDGVDPADVHRVEQFYKGGPLYCAACYAEVPKCDDCGWHIPTEEIPKHFRSVHAS